MPPACSARKGGEEACGGAGVADVQLCACVGDAAAFAFDGDSCGGLVGRALKAERSERFQHDAGVAAKQRAFEACFSFGECGEDQGTVGDAL